MQKSAMVNVCMRYKSRFSYSIEVRYDISDNIQHLGLVAGVSGVNKQIFSIAVYYDHIASARRFYQYKLSVFRYIVMCYPR